MRQSILLLFLVLIPVLALGQTAEEYFNEGMSKADRGDYSGAIQDYNKAIQLNPNIADAYNNRGLAKTKLGDYNGALQDFNNVIQLDPNISGAYYNRGAAKILLGQKDSGCIDLSKAGELGYSQANDAIKEYCR